MGAEQCNKEFTHCYVICVSDRDSGVSRGTGYILAKGRGIACSAGGAGRRGRTEALIKDLLARLVQDASMHISAAAAMQQTEIAIGFIVIDQYLISILLGVTA